LPRHMWRGDFRGTLGTRASWRRRFRLLTSRANRLQRRCGCTHELSHNRHLDKRREPTEWKMRPRPAGAQFSHKLGCGACTKCPDTHPKRGSLGSNSIRALRRRERAQRKRALADSTGGSLPPLQTMYQLPSHQQRRRLPHHSQPSHSGVHRSDKDCL
jgi:hypothetical protein